MKVRTARLVALVVTIGTVAGCSWLKPGEERPPAEKTTAAVVTLDDWETVRAEMSRGKSLASTLGLNVRVEAARVEQLVSHDPDYGFCRGTRCPPRTAKTISYSNDPEIRLKGVTTRGDGSTAPAAGAIPLERRTLTAAAFRAEGTLEAAATEQMIAFGQRNASRQFRVTYWIHEAATPQDELKATRRGAEIQNVLVRAGVPKGRISLRSEKGEGTGGRVAEVTVAEPGS